MRRNHATAALAAALLAGCSSTTVTRPDALTCKPVGAACGGNAECCSYGCVGTVCIANIVEGGACKTSDDCAWGDCHHGGCVSASLCRDLADVCTYDSQCCSSRCDPTDHCAENHAPVAAIAGGDQAVPWHTTIQLDGTASVDPDGDWLTYGWSLLPPPGSAAVLSSALSSQPTFYADVAGTYTVTLTVSDGSLTSSATVHLVAQDLAPVARPVATPVSLPKSNPVTLTAGTSSDPDGEAIVAYAWSVTGPAGDVPVTNASQPTASFVPPVAGSYTVTLSVSDPSKTGTATTTVTAIDTPPIASAGSTRYVNFGEAVTLDASGSTDADHDALTYTWSLVSQPGTGESLSQTGSNPQATFTPAAQGTYGFTVSVSDGTNPPSDASVSVVVLAPIEKLPFNVVDAEYSAYFDKFVIVSSIPSNALYVCAPGTCATASASATFASAPESVGVSPDGKSAAVGHNGSVTYVPDLSAVTTSSFAVDVVGTLTAYDVGDVVVSDPITYGKPAATNRFIYVAPRLSQGYLQGINVADGTSSASSFYTLDAGVKAKLRPNTNDVVSRYGSYTNAFIRHDISSGVLSSISGTAVYPAYWPGSHFWFWFSDDGAYLFAENGNVYNAADANLARAGILGSVLPTSSSTFAAIAHSSLWNSAQGQIAAVPWSDSTLQAGTVIQMFAAAPDTSSPPVFAKTSELALPQWASNGAPFATRGQYVFFRSDGGKKHVLIKTDASLTYPYGIVSF